MAKLPTVAIVGQTNVGKSSLFNRIYGSQEAIVAREAGTTRDNVVRRITDGDKSYWLVDTAGMKVAEDEFEASIQDQIADATELADVIIVMVDGTQYPSDEDRRIAKTALKSKKPVLLVVNKVDLSGSLDVNEFRRLGIKDILRTSAEHNRGVHALLEKISELLPAVRADAEDDDTLRIALIGRPNVGKSNLFNTLAGKQQAIVANIAGTTRDVNRVSVRYHGQTIELLDTAGVRRQGKQEVGIEKFSVLRTLAAIEEADVCFLLMDVNELNVQLDQRLAGLIAEAGKGLVLVVSKWDSILSRQEAEAKEAAENPIIEPETDEKTFTKAEKVRRAKAMKSGEVEAVGKDTFTRDALANKIAYNFKFTPWAPLIFTSSVTGQNVAKLFDLAVDIMVRRSQETKTRVLNDLLQKAIQKHPPSGLKNTHPKLRYIVQTDTTPPWFVIYGSNLKFVHWSYKRHLERLLREAYDYTGTPIKMSFRDEKQIKMNKDRVARGLEPVTKAYKQAKNAEK
jgi:GTP-binding protein